MNMSFGVMKVEFLVRVVRVVKGQVKRCEDCSGLVLGLV